MQLVGKCVSIGFVRFVLLLGEQRPLIRDLLMFVI